MAFETVDLKSGAGFKAMRFDGSYAHSVELAAVANEVLALNGLGRVETKGFNAYDDQGQRYQEYMVNLVGLDGIDNWVSNTMWVVRTAPDALEAFMDDKYRAKFTLPAGME